MEKRLVLVTGCNRGIGYALSKKLLMKGYSVIMTSRDESKGMQAFNTLKEQGSAHYHQLDVTSETSIEVLKQYVEETFGRLDVLINNAGINYDTWHDALNANLQEVHETLDANLFGPWRMAQTFIPLMKKQNFGRIVNVSSGAGALNGMGGGTPGYSISKAALNTLTIKLASNVRDHNILVNAVCPGWVKTDMGGAGAPRMPDEAADSIIWVAELPDNGDSGKFFRDGREIEW